MKLTRRHCLYLGAGFIFTAISPVYGGVQQEEEPWRAICRRWMHALMPDDEHGPGADTPFVWSRLEARMDSDPAVKRWLLAGFRVIADTAVPNDDHQLSTLLGEKTSAARFLNVLRIELIENYYGTGSGWQDLGFRSPPLS
jgi:hypothetical protein